LGKRLAEQFEAGVPPAVCRSLGQSSNLRVVGCSGAEVGSRVTPLLRVTPTGLRLTMRASGSTPAGVQIVVRESAVLGRGIQNPVALAVAWGDLVGS